MPFDGHSPRSESESRSIGFQFLQLGATNAIILLFWLGVGWLADDLFGTTPIFVLAGVAVGIGCCVLVMYRLLRRYIKD